VSADIDLHLFGLEVVEGDFDLKGFGNGDGFGGDVERDALVAVSCGASGLVEVAILNQWPRLHLWFGCGFGVAACEQQQQGKKEDDQFHGLNFREF